MTILSPRARRILATAILAVGVLQLGYAAYRFGTDDGQPWSFLIAGVCLVALGILTLVQVARSARR